MSRGAGTLEQTPRTVPRGNLGILNSVYLFIHLPAHPAKTKRFSESRMDPLGHVQGFPLCQADVPCRARSRHHQAAIWNTYIWNTSPLTIWQNPQPLYQIPTSPYRFRKVIAPARQRQCATVLPQSSSHLQAEYSAQSRIQILAGIPNFASGTERPSLSDMKLTGEREGKKLAKKKPDLIISGGTDDV